MNSKAKNQIEKDFAQENHPVGNGKRIALTSHDNAVAEIEEQPFGNFSKYRFMIWERKDGQWLKRHSKQYDAKRRARKKISLFEEQGIELFPTS